MTNLHKKLRGRAGVRTGDPCIAVRLAGDWVNTSSGATGEDLISGAFKLESDAQPFAPSALVVFRRAVKSEKF